MCVCVCVTYIVYIDIYIVHTERERDLKELAHRIVEAGKCKICRAGQQPGDLGKVNAVVLNVKAGNSGRISMLQSRGEFHFFRKL